MQRENRSLAFLCNVPDYEMTTSETIGNAIPDHTSCACSGYMQKEDVLIALPCTVTDYKRTMSVTTGNATTNHMPHLKP